MKQLPEYPEYLITEDGRVFSTHVNRFLSKRINNRGYHYFAVILEPNVYKNILVHRAVARVYGNLKDLHDLSFEVDHKDTNIDNNHNDNLQVLTKEEHIRKTNADNGFITRTPKFCCVCGVEIEWSAKTCRKHMTPTRKDIDITKEMIENAVQANGWTKAGKEFGLSDNGVRRRYKHLGGDPKQLRKTK